MSQTRSAVQPQASPPAKVIYFATGTPAEVVADFSRLRLSANGARLRVVAPADAADALRGAAALRPQQLILYRAASAPVLWLRLLAFLGLSRRAEVLCLTSPRRFRFLKLLALTLRGRVVFSPVSGARVPLGFVDLAGISLRQRRDAREERRKHLPIGILGSASGYYLERIIPAVRARYPGAPIHGLLLPSATAKTQRLFDAARTLQPTLPGVIREGRRLAAERSKYQRWVVPCTNEPYRLLKVLSCLWPLSRRQIYNELADGFAVRDWRTLGWHLRWRLRDQLSFQILSGSAGGSAHARLLHLILYGFRLTAAVPLLLRARLRAGDVYESDVESRRLRSRESASDAKREALQIKLAGGVSTSSRPPGDPGGPVTA